MTRIYHPYWLWEDYKNGMYEIEGNLTETQTEELTEKAKELLCNSTLFEYVALQVITKWKHAAEVNLTNPSRNYQAWIGQASCSYYWKCPEYITKYAWRLMTTEQQAEANRVADKVFAEWKKQVRGQLYAKKIFEY